MKLTVVIPAYNADATLGTTLDSVCAQSRRADGVVVVNDGSTDGTRALAESYRAALPQLTVITQENTGTAGAYNAGIARAGEGWVVMLSADDTLLSNHLATIEETYAHHHEASLISSNGYMLEDGVRSLVYGPKDAPFSLGRCTLIDLVQACFFAVGAAFEVTAFEAVGGFKNDLYAEDYLFFLELLASGHQHVFAPESTAVHRRSAQQKSNRALLMREEELTNFAYLKKHYKLDAPTLEAIAHKEAMLRRNIATRKMLYRLVGESRAEDFIRKRDARRKG